MNAALTSLASFSRTMLWYKFGTNKNTNKCFELLLIMIFQLFIRPVLLSESHFEPNCVGDQRILMAMRWGLVPSWFNKDLKQFKMKTINCRLEGIQTSHSNDDKSDKSGSELFKTPLKKGIKNS